MKGGVTIGRCGVREDLTSKIAYLSTSGKDLDEKE